MLVHHVLFWLKADTTDEQKASFRSGLESLEKVESIKSIIIGTPAPISRAVVDDTYSFSLNIVLMIWPDMMSIKHIRYTWPSSTLTGNILRRL